MGWNEIPLPWTLICLLVGKIRSSLISELDQLMSPLKCYSVQMYVVPANHRPDEDSTTFMAHHVGSNMFEAVKNLKHHSIKTAIVLLSIFTQGFSLC